MANFIRFLFSSVFWKNLGMMFLVTLLLLGVVYVGLSFYTHHGETITVPDLNSYSIQQVEDRLANLELRYHVIDSGWMQDVLPGTVIDQSPKPNAKVKRNRKVYLTVKAVNPPMTTIPDIKDNSLRYAQMQLENNDLYVDTMIYIPDLAKNAVLEIRIGNKQVEAGESVPKGTGITLVLGTGLNNQVVEIPNLVGNTFLQARLTLRAYDLNVGSVVKEGKVSNEDFAVVMRQFPEAAPDGSSTISIGQPVDLVISENPNLGNMPKDSYIEYEVPVEEEEEDTTGKE